MVAATAKLLAPAHARIAELMERYSLAVPSERVLALGLILMLLQVADGLLTAMGVSMLGNDAEGNPLLRGLMYNIGTLPTLILCKSAAICIVGVLCMISGSVRWIETAFQIVIAVYLLAAVIPWTIILTLNLA
jgi:hypothetical protein